MPAVQFREKLTGFVSDGAADFSRGYSDGVAGNAAKRVTMWLTIRIGDIDSFIRDPQQQATAEGRVYWSKLGRTVKVGDGRFNCFVDVGPAHKNGKEMRYRLSFLDSNGDAFTLLGYKTIRRTGLLSIWPSTTTLYTSICRGEVKNWPADDTSVVARGIMRLRIRDFLRQLTTFRSFDRTLWQSFKAIMRFVRHFTRHLWDVYGLRRRPHIIERKYPLYTLEGVDNAKVTTYPFTTRDGIGLSLMRFQLKPDESDPDQAKAGESRPNAVVLLHGLTTSTDMFILPEQEQNFVSFLHANGFSDVWSFDWRGSMRHNYDLFPNRFTLDDVALFDHPAAFRRIRKKVGPDCRIHVVAHCVGALTFLMSLYSKQLKDINIVSVIASSLALTPRVSRWQRVKLAFGPSYIGGVLRFPHLNPRSRNLPGIAPQGKVLAMMVSLLHPECRVPECNMISFMWGNGRPACFEHDKLHEDTHRRVGDLFGSVSVNFYRDIRKMVRRGVAVKRHVHDSRYDVLPNNYLEHAAEIDTPILFVRGRLNKVFWDSASVCYEVLQQLAPNQHLEHKIFEDYGHQDPFIGNNCHEETFPEYTKFLSQF